MKSKEYIMENMLSTLTELESSNENEHESLKLFTQGVLGALYDILDDDVPEEYRSRIEKAIWK